jgi:ABC-type glutathione transport system ATPase component
MILAKIILAGSLFAIVGATASAQATPPTQQTPPAAETRKGLVTVVNRLNGTIAIREEQDDKGKEGDKENKAKEKEKDKADVEDAATQFKIDHKLSESVHAGDKVKFSVRDGGDPKTSTEKTITKIEVD